MAVQTETIDLGPCAQPPEKTPVRPPTGLLGPTGGLLEALPTLPRGYRRIWDDTQKCYLTVRIDERSDYADWWSSQEEAYREKYGDCLLK